MLKDTPCSMKVFDDLRQMNAVRQIEAADLMIGQHNFTLMFARAIRAATPHSQLVAAKKMTGAAASTPPGQQIARMERELAALQTQVKASRKLTASTICILPSHADTLPSSSPTLASPGGFRITAKNILGSFRKSLRPILSRRPWTRKVPYGAETWPTGITKCSGLFVQDRIMYRAEPLRLSALSATSAKSSDPSASLLVVYTLARSRSQLRSTGATQTPAKMSAHERTDARRQRHKDSRHLATVSSL